MADTDRYRLAVEINRDSPEPVYEQIARHIRNDIRSGRLAPGHRIPSIIDLQHDTDGCAVLTIRKGIRLLAEQDYVRIVPGKGTYVNPPEQWEVRCLVCGYRTDRCTCPDGPTAIS